MRHLIGRSKNGLPAYIDLTCNSVAIKNIARQPHLLTLASEALGHIRLDGTDIALECDMGHPIGYDFVVEAAEDDSVFYVCLLGEKTFTRFTKKGTPTVATYVSIMLELDETGPSYNVLDIWVGHQRPPRPGSDGETDASRPFWTNHAYIFQNQPAQTNTLVRTCPY